MRQGCLLVNPELIAHVDIFDTIIDEFTLVRQLEVSADEHILIVEHENFLDAAIDDTLPFYDIELERVTEGIRIKSISQPYIHSKHFIKCQNKTEPPKAEGQESQEPLIWVP